MAVAAIVPALLSAGPSLIRMAGKVMGGKAEQVSEYAAGAVEAARNDGNPEQALESRIKDLDGESLATLAQVKLQLEQVEADREKTKILASVDRQRIVNTTMAAELDAKSTFKSGWRPLIGYVLAITFAEIGTALAIALVRTPSNLPELMDGIIALIVAMGAVLGVNINQRSKDKQVAMTGQQPTGIAQALLSVSRARNG